MLAERVFEWTQQWKEEGWAAGLEEGRKAGMEEGRKVGLEIGRAEGRAEAVSQALVHERTLLMRLAHKRFSVPTVQRLEAVLERISSPERLDEIAEAIVDCATEEEFWGRLSG